MNFKRKFASLVLSSLMLFTNASLALAGDFSDVSSDYWAYNEIKCLSEEGIIAGYPDETFRPEHPVSRAEFTNMTVMAFDKDGEPVLINNRFSDFNTSFWAHDVILRSAQMDLVVGYPDLTFKPENNIIKSEATSILANTMVEPPVKEGRPCVFGKFADMEEVAEWARPSFKKAIKNGIYVNYPKIDYLMPNKELTRAEAAVLLYKIRNNPSVLMAKFRGPELQERCRLAAVKKPVGPIVPVAEKLKVEEFRTIVEYLPVTPYTGEVREVEVTGKKAKIAAQNIIPVKLESPFSSKKYTEGDTVYFTVDKPVLTEEGTRLIPAGSRISAELVELEKGKPFHMNGEAEVSFKKLVTPDGQEYVLEGEVANEEVLERKFGMCNVKRLGYTTLATSAIGAILGVSIGALASETADGAQVGSILGASIGTALGLAAPGCGVETGTDETVYVELEKDLEVSL